VDSRHRAKEFLDFMRHIERASPKDLDLHIILDNSSTQKTAEVKDWLEKQPRIILHFTPTTAYWLYAAEGWLSQLERRAISRGVFNSVTALKDKIRRFSKADNAIPAKPLKWTKNAKSITGSVLRAGENADIVG
jgi:transposase